jgi:Cytosolic domain of 10TM putative phosphate transporter
MTKIWYGPFKLKYKNVDAIDYYEEKLRRLDEEIKALRKKEFEATPLAFVTMDSVASAVSNSCSVQKIPISNADLHLFSKWLFRPCSILLHCSY